MGKSDILSGNTFSYFDVFEEKKGNNESEEGC
jgi:hypothetical protein